MPLAALSPLGIDTASVTSALGGAGALLGAGYGLIFLWRFWITDLQSSSDENLCAVGNFFDELRCAVRRKT